MKTLLEDRYSPITRARGFFEKDAKSLTDDFINWQKDIYEKMPKLYRSCKVNQIEGSLENVISKLLPLKVHEDRYLFIPTVNNWTAYFTNGFRGSDGAPISYLPIRCKCRSIRLIVDPFKSSKESRGYEGSLILEIFGPEDSGTMQSNIIRLIWLEKDMGKWNFRESGKPLPFENIEKYKSRVKKEKFTFDILEEYLRELGLFPFNEEYYLPTGKKAFLVEVNHTSPFKNRSLSIEEATHYYDKK